MKREFLRNLKVGETALPDVVIDAIIAEHQRDLDAVKANPGANGGSGEKTFTQEEVNRIVSDRLARERDKSAQQPQEDEREKALKAREARLPSTGSDARRLCTDEEVQGYRDGDKRRQ